MFSNREVLVLHMHVSNKMVYYVYTLQASYYVYIYVAQSCISKYIAILIQ